MVWSTRELAELASTTVNTIRHYHRTGLLEEPERRLNGYKQYGVDHLVRLLRIRRLAELGVPLSQVGPLSDGGESMREVLPQIDAELAERIESLQQARADIATILHDHAPADAPAGFTSVASHLSASDRSILHIYTQLYDDEAMADLRRMVEVDAETATVGAEIAALPTDADEATRQRLAEQLAPTLAQHLVDYPWLSDPAGQGHLSQSVHVTRQTVTEAMRELYNPAQIDVLARAGLLAHERLRVTAKGQGQEQEKEQPVATLTAV